MDYNNSNLVQHSIPPEIRSTILVGIYLLIFNLINYKSSICSWAKSLHIGNEELAFKYLFVQNCGVRMAFYTNLRKGSWCLVEGLCDAKSKIGIIPRRLFFLNKFLLTINY